MNRRSVVAVMVVGASMLTSEAMYAASPMYANPVIQTPVHAMFAKEKMVSFSLHNATATPIKVKAGATEMTLAPGSVTPVKLAVGVQIVAVDATPHYEAGSVLTTVGTQLSDATITLQ